MWLELSDSWIVILNVLGIPTVHLLVSWWATRLPISHFQPESFFYREREWENGGQLYQRWFFIRHWKRHLPDAAPWFHGFAKGHLQSNNPDYLRRFLTETCRGEFAHWVQLSLLLAFLLWNPYPANYVIVAYAILANLPCIVSLRFTRLRLRRFLRAQERRSTPTSIIHSS